MKYLTHSGEFLSVAGVTWRCDILRESDTEFAETGDLKIVDVEIEWEKKDKEEPVCGSVATVTVLSPGDRTYAGLYSIAPGEILLEVYRENSLYWCGCLDPEFYEEPYAYGSAYTVSLTFSDFGILDRLKYKRTDLTTVRTVVEESLTRAGLPLAVDYDKISSYVEGLAATPLLDAIAVRSENWTDESGETSSLKEVIGEMLRPLALKMVQKAGKIYIYDINGLYNSYGSEEIEWASADQKLGTDKVANNVTVTFSPYAGGELVDTETGVDLSGDTADKVNTDTADFDWFTFYKDLSSGVADNSNLSFTIFFHPKTSGKMIELGGDAAYFHILPLLDGEECEGVREWFVSGSDKITGGTSRTGFPAAKFAAGETVFSTKAFYLPDMSQTSGDKPLLKITLEMLMDGRYNPFESEDVMDGMDEMVEFEKILYAKIPVKIVLYSERGVALYHYTNASVVETAITDAGINATLGEWVTGNDTDNGTMLMYYSDSFAAGEAVGGWKANRQAVGYGSTLLPSFLNLDDGQFIPYPPAGGYLQISVMGGRKVAVKASGSTYVGGVAELPAANADEWTRWVLYKIPSVELVNNDITHGEVSSDDVVYSGVLNENAKDPLAIDTVCGTMPSVNPSARGLLYRSDGSLVENMVRAGRTARPEQLLIGTMYSQYAGRMTVLTGTAGILSSGLKWYTDGALDGTQLMILGDVQDLGEDTSEITAAEFRPDEYKSTGE